MISTYIIKEPKPDRPYDEKHKEWPRWTLWEYTSKYKDGTIQKNYMDKSTHNIYLAEQPLLAMVNTIFNLIPSPLKTIQIDAKKQLLDFIKKYGNTREEKGRHDVNEDWAESEAGEGL